jgi:FAD:protein FMN transferase
MFIRFFYGLSFIVIGHFISACVKQPDHLPEYVFKGDTMGTYWVAKVVTTKPISAQAVLSEIQISLERELLAVNQAYSTYISNSLLEQFNAFESTNGFSVDADFISMLEIAKLVHTESDGLYDVTIDPLVRLWGFGPNKVVEAPAPAKIKEILDYVGLDKLIWSKENFKISKRHPKLRVDLSSIAKGRGVDRVFQLLKTKYSFENILVEIGGEVRAAGINKLYQPWSVGVELPSEELGAGVAKVISLNNESVATSGSYRNFKKYNNKKYSHTLNPKSGQPIDSDLISASVIASDCTTADAWATAMMALGAEKALMAANRNKLKVILLVLNKDQTLKVVESDLMKTN